MLHFSFRLDDTSGQTVQVGPRGGVLLSLYFVSVKAI
jgi:hypothetical protein